MYGLARSSGLGFWESLAYSNVGSFLWKMAGETDPPSINDQITTGNAGSLLGEALFRMAGLVLEEGGDKLRKPRLPVANRLPRFEHGPLPRHDRSELGGPWYRAAGFSPCRCRLRSCRDDTGRRGRSGLPLRRCPAGAPSPFVCSLATEPHSNWTRVATMSQARANSTASAQAAILWIAQGLGDDCPRQDGIQRQGLRSPRYRTSIRRVDP